MDTYKEELLRKYLDGELGPEKEREALHMIADDEEMRSMLRFEQKLQLGFRQERDAASFEVPEGFSNRVMSAIHRLDEKEEERIAMIERLSSIVKGFWRPRQIQLRPVYALCMLLAIGALWVIPANTDFDDGPASEGVQSVQPVAESTGQQVWTRFVFIDKEAESVAVAGDFSNWEPIELSKKTLNGEQVWTGLIAMGKGEHRYMFVKDGTNWVTDPLATNYENDGFGNKNAVIYL